MLDQRCSLTIILCANVIFKAAVHINRVHFYILQNQRKSILQKENHSHSGTVITKVRKAEHAPAA